MSTQPEGTPPDFAARRAFRAALDAADALKCPGEAECLFIALAKDIVPWLLADHEDGA